MLPGIRLRRQRELTFPFTIHFQNANAFLPQLLFLSYNSAPGGSVSNASFHLPSLPLYPVYVQTLLQQALVENSETCCVFSLTQVGSVGRHALS